MGVACGECGYPMMLRQSRFGQFYGCTRFPQCTGTHGAHPDGSPLGVPANSETKLARIQAHAAFDTLWRGDAPLMSRKDAYRWMQETMGLDKDNAHIGMFTVGQCAALIASVAERKAHA